jgi:hypothetical protein
MKVASAKVAVKACILSRFDFANFAEVCDALI